MYVQQGFAPQRLQLHMGNKHYLIIDEMSMLGQRVLAWVHGKKIKASHMQLNETNRLVVFPS